jgi:hypothetical protein
VSVEYEALVEDLTESDCPSQAAREAGADAMAFLLLLNSALKESGAPLSDTPDAARLGSMIDGVFGELAAASLFLSEKVFARVPELLRKYADGLEKMDSNFTDPDGHTGPSVPQPILSGFRSLATRIESTRDQKVELVSALRRVQATE